MASVEQINRYLQFRLRETARKEVSAVEAAQMAG